MIIPFNSTLRIQALLKCFEEKREVENETASLIEYSQNHRLAESDFDKKNLFHPNAYQNSHKRLIEELPFINFSEYMQFAMFESKQGYYGSGKVNFEVDFSTNATGDCALAFTNLMDMFRQWMNSGQPKEFYNYEGGAGNGRLAFITLFFAETFAKISQNNNEFNLGWCKFYDALHYVIVELSPALVERQSRLCKNYIDKNKLLILNASVYEFTPRTKIHRYCSNELLDDLPLEGFTKDTQGNVLVLTKLQVVPKHILLNDSNVSLSEIDKQDRDYRELLRNIFGISNIPLNVYVLNKPFLSQFPKGLKSLSQYHDVYLPLQYFEFSLSVLKDNFYIMPDLKCNETIYVSAYLNKLAKMIGSADRILFFDYGGIDKQISPDLRYYDNPSEDELQKRRLFDFTVTENGLEIRFGNSDQHQSIPKNIFVNITHDVDFYAVMRIFERYQFKTEMYGHQSLILSEMDRKSLEQAIPMYYKFIEENGFLTVREDGAKFIENSRDIVPSGIQSFQCKPCSSRFIVMEKQPELAENYHPLPDLKSNYVFWNQREKRRLEENRNDNPKSRKDYDNRFGLVPYNKVCL